MTTRTAPTYRIYRDRREVRSELAARGMSIAELARQCNMEYRRVFAIVSGMARPTLPVMVAISNAIGVEPGALFPHGEYEDAVDAAARAGGAQ